MDDIKIVICQKKVVKQLAGAGWRQGTAHILDRTQPGHDHLDNETLNRDAVRGTILPDIISVLDCNFCHDMDIINYYVSICLPAGIWIFCHFCSLPLYILQYQ